MISLAYLQLYIDKYVIPYQQLRKDNVMFEIHKTSFEILNFDNGILDTLIKSVFIKTSKVLHIPYTIV